MDLLDASSVIPLVLYPNRKCPISIATISLTMMWYVCELLKNPPKNLKAIFVDTSQMRISRVFCCWITSEASPQIHHKVRLIKISLAPGGVFVFGFDHTGFCCLKHLVFGSPESSGLGKKQPSNPCISWNEETLVSHFKTLVIKTEQKIIIQEFHKLGTWNKIENRFPVMIILYLYTLHSTRTDGLMQS